MTKNTFTSLAARLIESSPLTHRELAERMGLRRPNVVAMFKAGTTKMPLKRVRAFAHAVGMEPAHLVRLALEEYEPEDLAAIEEWCGPIVSTNERAILQTIRRASGGADPSPTELQQLVLRCLFA